MPDQEREEHPPSIVDVLMGRHQHEPQVKVTTSQRVYGNYRFDEASWKAEVTTGGRQRNRAELEDESNPVAQTIRQRGY